MSTSTKDLLIAELMTYPRLAVISAASQVARPGTPGSGALGGAPNSPERRVACALLGALVGTAVDAGSVDRAINYAMTTLEREPGSDPSTLRAGIQLTSEWFHRVGAELDRLSPTHGMGE